MGNMMYEINSLLGIKFIGYCVMCIGQFILLLLHSIYISKSLSVHLLSVNHVYIYICGHEYLHIQTNPEV